MNSIIQSIRKIIIFLRQAKKLYKYGGYTTANISIIDYGKIFQDTNILITGGSQGIGLSIAKKFLSLGANVLITGRNEKALKEVVSTTNHPRLHYIQWDISDIKNLESKIDEAQTLLKGEINILINNAGVYSDTTFPYCTDKDWDKVYNINSKGTFFISQAFCKRWLSNPSQKYRKIINISSQGGFVGANNAYRMTKWDLRGLTEFLGRSMCQHGIIVNGIAPGIIMTGMQPEILKQKDNLFTTLNPLNRIGLPSEIAELVIFLASNASNFIIGQTICCDGGYTLK